MKLFQLFDFVVNEYIIVWVFSYHWMASFWTLNDWGEFVSTLMQSLFRNFLEMTMLTFIYDMILFLINLLKYATKLIW